ncbi:alkylmercury lyase family protein [Fictibacillus sp. 5RED26]|uniref:alkylmercury lyase family protein n=1 Tax=Fictibacillus sp. 5RED26 TaxID=2745876 RepID=UPI0018CF94BE|nr:alkylmercury lyase family protein [Fictibacillus sp. 5RED26]MBH0158580.1 alkylmercury lyase family protein [Fictibacillus sp. 5RED26]
MNQNHMNTSLKDKMLQSLGLPVGGFEEKIRLLSPSENSIRLDILLSMAEGQILNINDLTETKEQIDIQSSLQRLRELDLIHWDQNSGNVTVAYPFSGVPTPHRVTLAGMSPAYSMCAIDALGIPSMFTDAVIESECAFCGEKITINVKRNVPVANPDTVVVGLGTTDAADTNACCDSSSGPNEPTPVATSCCPAIQFYCCEEHWQKANEKNSTTAKDKLTLVEAFEVGAAVFGGTLSGL